MRKGSSTLVALVCCLVCAGLGILYGFSPKDTPTAIAPAMVYRAEHPAAGTVSITPVHKANPANVERDIEFIPDSRPGTSRPTAAGKATFSHVGNTATASY
jgi:hypothetical protein